MVQKVDLTPEKVDLLVKRDKRTSLDLVLSKLDPVEEQRMAEEGLGYAWETY